MSVAHLSEILAEILLSSDICCLVDSLIHRDCELVTRTDPLEQLNVKCPELKLSGVTKIVILGCC